MTTDELAALRGSLQALAIFRGLLADPVVAALDRCLALRTDRNAAPVEANAAYGALVSRLYAEASGDLGRYLQNLVEDDDNAYMRAIGRGERVPPVMERCLEAELQVLQAAAGLVPEDLRFQLTAILQPLPDFASSTVDIPAAFRRRAENIGRRGYGVYARHVMFYLEGPDRVVPVRHPDGVRLADLVGYRRERTLVLENTRALLAGKPAASLLLTGDAGTGKSSTVKAVVNELAPEGLRIIEVRKNQLRLLPGLLDALAENPLKFILFIDDLSFQKGDDNYSALKAVLEGSVSARSSNVVLYATSNRRHLVKESFSDREGDDVHQGDTIQELISLSERFGLHVAFQKPGKDAYLRIVRRLAEERGLDRPDLELLAERFALARGGRSPRAARQLVDNLAAGNLEDMGE